MHSVVPSLRNDGFSTSTLLRTHPHRASPSHTYTLTRTVTSHVQTLPLDAMAEASMASCVHVQTVHSQNTASLILSSGKSSSTQTSSMAPCVNASSHQQ